MVTYHSHLCIICNDRWGEGSGTVEISLCQRCLKAYNPEDGKKRNAAGANSDAEAVAFVYKRVSERKRTTERTLLHYLR